MLGGLPPSAPLNMNFIGIVHGRGGEVEGVCGSSDGSGLG